ncbi:hypothetical protein LAZ67_6001951 [Cordylochernes scorpioides]|uniref:Gag-pol polyprotein n=1 Tax=Cordylochernes scorpioides TaxID=51811 RepID=A0ABY6KK50_9ARAC|nr:hypothetical protein LAZ67_6001951 [Cordylochernes scorpioides]
MTTELPQIQKFNGDNFHLWKFQMKIILEAKDLLSVTDGSEVKPEIEDIAKFSNWKKKDAKSKMLITTALKFKYLQQIVNCQTSAEMWKKLSTIYELKSETNKYLLQQRFFEYKMNPNDNIATHISKVETLAQQMKDLGEPISDVALITKIICSLPDKYKNFITAWDSVSSEEKTLENLTARLLKEESLQDHWDSSGNFKPDNALMTFSKFNRNSTASNKQQQHQQSIKDKKKNTHCGYCKKKGHWWKECYKRKEEQKGQQPSSSSRDDSCAFSAETSAFLAETKDSWIADSGATDHMTFRREWFSTFEEIPEGVHPVCLGDGKQIYAKANTSENIQDNQQEQVTIYSEESVDNTNTSSKPEESCRYPLRNRIRENEQTSTSCTRAISYACYVHDQEPLNYEDAIVGQNSKQWKLAMDDEFNSLMKNQTWTYVTLPSDRKAIACKWVYKIKQNADGSNKMFKARLVAKGYSQKPGLDYGETFSPVVKFDSIRTILSLCASLDMEMIQLDVKSAFLNGDLEEELYMEQPQGYENPDFPNHVCSLQKSIYGLKQSPRMWNKKFHEFLIKFDLKPSISDSCVYTMKCKQAYILLAIYVDDCLICSVNKQHLDDIVQYLNSNFEIKTFTANYFLGLQIYRDRTTKMLFLHQASYIERTLEHYNLLDIKLQSVPSDPYSKLTKKMCPKDDQEIEEMNKIPYRQTIGSLMYLMTGTRPDIAYAVSRVSQFMNNPGPSHWTAVKKIFGYLKATKNIGICFGGSSCTSTLIGFSDADFAGDLDTRKSTTGYVFMLNNGPISWCSQKHAIDLLYVCSNDQAADIFTKALPPERYRRLRSQLGLFETTECSSVSHKGRVETVQYDVSLTQTWVQGPSTGRTHPESDLLPERYLLQVRSVHFLGRHPADLVPGHCQIPPDSQPRVRPLVCPSQLVRTLPIKHNKIIGLVPLSDKSLAVFCSNGTLKLVHPTSDFSEAACTCVRIPTEGPDHSVIQVYSKKGLKDHPEAKVYNNLQILNQGISVDQMKSELKTVAQYVSSMFI